MLTDGTPSVAALETVYGVPIEELQRKVQTYVRQNRLNGAFFDIKLEKSAERPSVEPAAGLEVSLLLADLLAKTKKTEEARAMYEKISSENPEAPGLHEGLGELEYLLGDKDQARIHFGRAFELGSNNLRMLKRYARLQREAGDEKIVMTLLRAVKGLTRGCRNEACLGKPPSSKRLLLAGRGGSRENPERETQIRQDRRFACWLLPT